MFRNVRFYILVTSFLFSICVYFFVISSYSSPRLQTIRLTQIFALSSVTLLYLALLIGPLTYLLPKHSLTNQIHKSRRGIGVSAFYFAVIHASLAFFGQLGGFSGLPFLNQKYLLAISLSFTALCILSLMALTSFDFIISRMKFRRWKILHRLLYIAAVFILIHALMLGTHFADLSQAIPQIFLTAFFILLILEANRFDFFLRGKIPALPEFGPFTTIISSTVLLYFVLTFIPKDTPLSLGIHALHIQLAKDAQQQTTSPANIPGLVGDRTKRFSVSFNNPQDNLAGTETKLEFKVNDAATGDRVVSFNRIYDKLVHLIIVSNDLQYFDHIHPDAVEDGFLIYYKFPQDGTYRAYLDFQPVGAIEQQFAFNIKVGSQNHGLKNNEQESDFSKSFGDYQVALNFPKPLKSQSISIGEQKLTFTITDANTGSPVTNLKPYLASFGHLVMINTQTYEYIHVHPTQVQIPKPEDTAGPTVEFMPIGIYGTIKPGTYKIFAQFNPDDKLFTSDFIIKVE